MTTALVMPVQAESKWSPIEQPTFVGKDILELLSSSMYVDPMSLYREYIQNGADAIDEARDAGLFSSNAQPRIDVRLDLAKRCVTIRDNGIGISSNVFARRLTALGASSKRGGGNCARL